MKRFALFLASLVVALGIAASTATADGCACGGSYPQLVGSQGPYNTSGGQACLNTYDMGPGTSPRIDSRWEAPRSPGACP